MVEPKLKLGASWYIVRQIGWNPPLVESKIDKVSSITCDVYFACGCIVSESFLIYRNNTQHYCTSQYHINVKDDDQDYGDV